MTDIPIIFSAPMVQALLAGRKTMTRRLAWRPARKGEATAEGSRMGYVLDDNGFTGTITKHERPSAWRRVKPGDRLWVRESLKHVTSDPVTDEPCSLHCYMASIPPGMDCANPYEDNYLFSNDGSPALKAHSIPSIHMPRWCSRLTLVVTGIKVERLQDLSHEDAMAEGVQRTVGIGCYGVIGPNGGWLGSTFDSAPAAFSYLWMSLHGAESWNENPEVVALSFSVVNANIDAPEAMAA